MNEATDDQSPGEVKSWWRTERQTILVTIIATLIVTAVLSGVATIWNLSTDQHAAPSDLVVLLVVSGVSAIALALVIFRRARLEALRLFEPGLREQLLPGLREEARREFEKEIGLVAVYDNFDAAKADLLSSLQRSANVAIFLQLGRTIIAGGNDFYDTLMSISLKEGAVLRVLHAGKDSPYLSRRAASERGSNYNRWQDDLRNAERKLATLSKERGQTVQARQHLEGYVWQLFIFDDFAFVQPYLMAKSNQRSAPVLKFGRFLPSSEQLPRVENRRSMYHAFTRFFDLKWDERRPDATSLADFVVEQDAVVVAGSIMTEDDLHVFVLPRRYISTEGRDIKFHCAGGKPHTDESLLDALHRELREELGVDFDVPHTERMTRFVTSYAEQSPMLVTDTPQPSIIYNRIREDDPNLAGNDQWIVAWRATVRPADDGSRRKLKPKAEVGAVLYLSSELLRETASRRVTYQEIQHSKDGSKLVLEQGLSFDFQKNAVPTGMASILASSPPDGPVPG